MQLRLKPETQIKQNNLLIFPDLHFSSAFPKTAHKDHFLMSDLLNFTGFCKYLLIVNVMQQHVQQEQRLTGKVVFCYKNTCLDLFHR